MQETSGRGYDAALFAEIAALEDGSFWFSERNRLIEWALRHYASDMRAFLEVGCGTGHVLSAVEAAFPQARCFGIEPFEIAIEIARGRATGAEIRQGTAVSLGSNEQFDAVGCFDVLEHIVDDRAALTAMATALRPGGVLVVTVPQHRWLWSDADESAEHVRRYRRSELVDRVHAAGLRVRRCTSFVTTLLPMLAASRVVRRIRPPKDPLQELRLSPRIQAALRLGIALDRAAIRAGASLPVGGSLLLIASRPPAA
jgi:SAM-dependent methyltransferase